jgi:hypothetical protein
LNFQSGSGLPVLRFDAPLLSKDNELFAEEGLTKPTDNVNGGRGIIIKMNTLHATINVFVGLAPSFGLGSSVHQWVRWVSGVNFAGRCWRFVCVEAFSLPALPTGELNSFVPAVRVIEFFGR